MTVTKAQVTAYVRTVAAVAEAIRELGSVPSGHLYAQLMATGMTLEIYQKIIDALKGAGLVKESNHLLTWIDVHSPEDRHGRTSEWHSRTGHGI